MPFNEINITDETLSPFSMLSKDWFLITSGTPTDFNTMTASWGGMGVMWGKNIFTSVIRPSRHTYKYLEDNDTFSISFFDEKNREDLNFCGSHSGRDCDKCAETNLTPATIDGIPTFEEATMVFICKKIYKDSIDEENFIDNNLFKFYEKDPYHIAFVGEIVKAYVK